MALDLMMIIINKIIINTASSSNEATLTTPMDTITIAHNSGECDHHLTSHVSFIIHIRSPLKLRL